MVYTQDPFDRSRFERLRDVAADLAEMVLGAVPPEPAAPLVRAAPLVGVEPQAPATVADAVRAEQGYLTPKIDLRAAVSDDRGRLLMVREASDGLWTLPGGWADIHETLAEGVVREVREESGYEVRVDRLLGIYDRERWGHPPMLHWTLKAVLACTVVGGSPRTSLETLDVGWFAPHDVPPLSLGRLSPRLLSRVFEHVRRPDQMPDL